MTIEGVRNIIRYNICGDGYDADVRAENIENAIYELLNIPTVPEETIK